VMPAAPPAAAAGDGDAAVRGGKTAMVPCTADGCSPGRWMGLGLPDAGGGAARVSPCQLSPSPGNCMLGHGRDSMPACPRPSAASGGPSHVPRGAEVEVDSRCTPLRQCSLPRTHVSSTRCCQSHGGSGCLAGDNAAIRAAESFLSRYRTASKIGSATFDLAPRFGACEEDRWLDTVDMTLLTPRASVQTASPGLEARVSEAEAHAASQEPGPLERASHVQELAAHQGGGSATPRDAEPEETWMASGAPQAQDAKAANLSAILDLLRGFRRQVGSPLLSLPDPHVVRRRLFSGVHP
jgi:hypothetical protein